MRECASMCVLRIPGTQSEIHPWDPQTTNDVTMLADMVHYLTLSFWMI